MESRSSGISGRRDQQTTSANVHRAVVARIIPIERTAPPAHGQATGEEPFLADPSPRNQDSLQNLVAVHQAPASAYSPDGDEASRCDLLIATGEEQRRCGHHADAQKSLCEAAMLAERIGDGLRLTRAVLGLPGWDSVYPQPANPVARVLAERALTLVQHDVAARAMLMARLAAEIFSLGEEKRGLEIEANAAHLLNAANNPRAQLYVLCCRDRMLRQVDRLAERLSNAEEIFRLAVESGDYAACHLSTLVKCESLAISGRMQEAHQTARLAGGITSMGHLELHAGSALAYQSACAVMEGRFSEALETFASCKALIAEGKPSRVLDFCWPLMLVPLDESGRLCELEAAAESASSRRPGVAVYEALLAWLRARLGNLPDALFMLRRFAADGFAEVSRAEQSLVSLAALAEVCAQVNRHDYAALLYERLAPHASLATTLGSVAVFGSVEYHLGRLAAVMGRDEDAVRHLENAIEKNLRIGARPWAVYSSYELARVLAGQRTNFARERSLEWMAQVETEATALDMPRVVASAREVRERLAADVNVGMQTACNESSLVPLSTNGAEVGCGAGAAPAQNGPAKEVNDAMLTDESQHQQKHLAFFRHQGDFWLIGSRSNGIPVKHRAGLSLISYLLRHPGREICATELTAKGESSGRGGAVGRSSGAGDSDPVLDATAKQSYRARLDHLREEQEQARGFNDFDRAEKIGREIEFLSVELARALGLGGRDRKLGSESERARKRVRSAISDAIRAVLNHDAYVGRHLMRCIHTGTLCSYTPDAENPIEWEF